MNNLFEKYIENKCSPDEVRQLLKAFDSGDNEELLRQLIQKQLGAAKTTVSEADIDFSFQLNESYQKIQAEIRAADRHKDAIVLKMKKPQWLKFAAAASIVLLLSTTVYLISLNNNKKQIAKIANNNKLQNDVAPGGNRAVLTLADGSTILLDNAQNGTLAQQGNTKILKSNNGELSYNSLDEKPAEILYNTIATPRGGQYQLSLTDGSKVWLNAASSLRFPAVFSGKERKVELTGEAYFEVAHNAAKPFKVNVAGKGEVEVLGTHFNINAYDDEAFIKTTLLEGSVRISAANAKQPVIIKPGQQAVLSTSGQLTADNNIDIDEVMAWKNGLFNFNNAGIQTIMRQVARWYDVDIIFEGAVPAGHYSGKVSRNISASQMLKVLEESGVKFKIEGNKITVQQQK